MSTQKVAQDKLDMTVHLFDYIQHNDIQEARDLLAKAKREDMLHDVCMADIHTKAKWLAEIPRSTTNYAYYQFIQGDSRVPLLEAIEKQRVAIVEAMLRVGLDVNVVDTEERGWSFTPLQAAAKSKSLRIGELLLNFGADPLRKNCFLQTALFEAVMSRQKDFVKVLLKKTGGADVNWFDTFKKTPIMHLLGRKVDGDDIDILKFLIQCKADVKQKHDKMTLVGMTVQYYTGSYTLKALQMLLASGARVNEPGPSGKTPLHFACMPESFNASKKMSSRKRYHLVCLLLKHKANTKVHDDDHNTPLHYAAKHDLPKIAEILIQYRASLNKMNLEGNRPIDLVTPKSSVRTILEEAMVDTVSIASSAAVTPGPLKPTTEAFVFSPLNPSYPVGQVGLGLDTSQLAEKINELKVVVDSFEGKLEAAVAKQQEKPRKSFSLRNAFARKSIEDAISVASTLDEEDIYGPDTPQTPTSESGTLDGRPGSFGSRNGTLDSKNGTLDIMKEYNKIKIAVENLIPFIQSPTEISVTEQKTYKACRIVSETLGHDWKNLFRELVSHVANPSQIEAHILDIEKNYQRLSEQGLQSLLAWKSFVGRDANCETLVKGLMENRLMGAVEILEDRLLNVEE